MNRRCVALTIILAVAACGGDVTPARLAGSYVMTQPWNADTLSLTADGRYHRVFVARNAPAVIDTGAWFLSRDKKTVVLRGYPKRWAFVHDLMNDTTHGRVLLVPSTVGLSVAHAWNRKPRLDWYPSFGWRYTRVGSGE